MPQSTNQDLDSLTYLKGLVLRYPQFSKLPDKDKKFVTAAFLLNNGLFGSHLFNTPEEAFSAFTADSSILDTVFLSREDSPLRHQSAAINQALLARLVVEYHYNQEQVEETLAKHRPDLTTKQRAIVAKVLKLNQMRQVLEQNKKQPLVDTETFNSALNETGSKNNPTQAAVQTAAILAASFNLSPDQSQEFTQNLILSVDEDFQPPNIRKLVETVANPANSLKVQESAIRELQETLSVSPSASQVVFDLIRNSSLPPKTKDTLAEALTDPSQTTTVLHLLQQTPELLSTLAVANYPPLSSNLDITTALALVDPKQAPAIADLLQQISQKTTPVSPEQIFVLPPTFLLDSATQTSINLATLSVPSEKNLSTYFPLPPDTVEYLSQLHQTVAQTLDTLASNPIILGHLDPSENFAHQLTTAARQDLPETPFLAYPPQTASQAAAITDGLGGKTLGISIRFLSQTGSATLSQIASAASNPNSNLGKIRQKDPLRFFAILAGARSVSNSALGQEISPQSRQTPSSAGSSPNIFGKISSFFTKPLALINNKIPQLPGGQYLNAIFHPVQFVKSWLGRKAGEFFVRQIGSKIGKTLLRSAINTFGKKAVNALLKKGLKEGAKFIAKQALVQGLAAASQALNAIPGLGIAVGIIVEVGAFLIEKTIGQIKKALDELAVALWGEKVRARDLAGMAGAGISALVMAPVALMTTVATATAAAIATPILAAVGVAVFLYLSTFTIAPIIGSFAQLGLPTAGTSFGLGTYTPNPNDTFTDTNNKFECFVFSGQYPWSDQQKTTFRSFISQLPSSLLTKICAGGDIQLVYGGNNGSVGGFVLGNTITIYDKGFNLYTLSHETGHIFIHHYGNIFQDFHLDQNILKEGRVRTYPFNSTAGDDEDFAETVALYISNPQLLSSQYPAHYKFAQEHIFN